MSDIAKYSLGGPAWLRAIAADKEEMLSALGSIDAEGEKEERREIQGLRVAAQHMEHMEVALQVIMDETQKHFEHNPESQTARLPMGYNKILNTAHYALNT